MAFNINHGARHLSGLNHAGEPNGHDNDGNSDRTGHPFYVPTEPNVMSDGEWVQSHDPIYKLKDYINSTSNQQPPANHGSYSTVSIIQAYMHKFSVPKPNVKLPTQPTQ